MRWVRSDEERGRSPARRAALAATALAILVPAIALAHPLGNFTINHFAAIRVSSERISLDIVIDRAEIPAFQEQQRLGVDGEGTLAPAVLERERHAACLTLASDLRLAVGGRVLQPNLIAAGLLLPAGAGGLSTMRLVCEYEAALSSPITSPSMVSFEDRSFAERIGWREIVVLGSGTEVADAPGDADGVSSRLTAYPTDLLTQPLDVRSVSVAVSPGGPSLAPWSAPDAQAFEPTSATSGSIGAGANPAANPAGTPIGAVPGGIAENMAALVDVQDLTPLAVLASLAIAFALGVIHAVSPGHGKTIMAAYLVGAKGSSRQAVGLGLAVTVSHTLGVLALAGITLAASSVLPPERLYPILGVASGGLVIAIGASLLWSRLRAIGLRGRTKTHADDHAPDQAHAHNHHDGHDDGHGHDTRTRTRTPRPTRPSRGAASSRSGCPAGWCLRHRP